MFRSNSFHINTGGGEATEKAKKQHDSHKNGETIKRKEIYRSNLSHIHTGGREATVDRARVAKRENVGSVEALRP